MEMAARAVGWLAYSSGSYAAEYVEHEVKRGLEWLTGDRQESKRLAAVSSILHIHVPVDNYFYKFTKSKNQTIHLINSIEK